MPSPKPKFSLYLKPEYDPDFIDMEYPPRAGKLNYQGNEYYITKIEAAHIASEAGHHHTTYEVFVERTYRDEENSMVTKEKLTIHSQEGHVPCVTGRSSELANVNLIGQETVWRRNRGAHGRGL